MKVGTPLACSEELESQLLHRLKELEIVGFQEQSVKRERRNEVYAEEEHTDTVEVGFDGEETAV